MDCEKILATLRDITRRANTAARALNHADTVSMLDDCHEIAALVESIRAEVRASCLRTMTVSFKPEVIADSSGTWCSNEHRYATKAEAEAYADDLALRWTLVREWRVVECDDPVTHAYVEGRSIPV